jgi:hypothetical protein
MAMQMQRAFNSRMLTKVTKYTQAIGSFDSFNKWVDGAITPSIIWAVIKSGNRFSKFEEGIALHNEDGGTRYSNYKTLHITDKFTVELGDKVLHKNAYYSILQQSEESVYGFTSYIIEKSENWEP